MQLLDRITETRIIRVNPESPDIERIREAARIIADGGLTAFPTETVYGLGADAFSSAAVKHVFNAKGRPADNPLIVHIANLAQLQDVAEEVPSIGRKLISHFWPGPLTVVVKKRKRIPGIVTAGLDTVAVRLPSHRVAKLLIQEAKTAIAAPSANISGSPSPTKFQHVFKDLYGRVEAIIDGGSTPIGVESTVVDVTAEPPRLLRLGAIPPKNIKTFTGELLIPTSLPSESPHDIPKSPGMKHRHYAPKTRLILVEGELKWVQKHIEQLAREFAHSSLKVGVLAARGRYRVGKVRRLGDGTTLESMASDLFAGLRDLDELNLDVVLAEGVEEIGLGSTVMDRLRKASGGSIIRT